eukprot:UN04249
MGSCLSDSSSIKSSLRRNIAIIGPSKSGKTVLYWTMRKLASKFHEYPVEFDEIYSFWEHHEAAMHSISQYHTLIFVFDLLDEASFNKCLLMYLSVNEAIPSKKCLLVGAKLDFEITR